MKKHDTYFNDELMKMTKIHLLHHALVGTALFKQFIPKRIQASNCNKVEKNGVAFPNNFAQANSSGSDQSRDNAS